MSMFLVSLGIIVAAIACSTWLALRDADQRATTRAPTRRARPVSLPAASGTLARPAPAQPRAPRQPDFVYVPAGRARAGLALGVLATFVGVLVALAVAGGIVFVAEGLRNSVR